MEREAAIFRTSRAKYCCHVSLCVVKRKICTVQRRTASRPRLTRSWGPHMGGNAQVGERATNKTARTKNANTVQSTPNPNTSEDTHLARKTAQDSGSDIRQSNTSRYWQTGSSKNKTTAKQHTTQQKHCKQHDYVLMNRALFEHCKEAETPGHFDMNSKHEAAIARIEQTTIKIWRKTKPRNNY